MTLTTLILMIGAIALGLTVLVGLAFKSHKSWVMTFLQNFCGALFVFSGFVKAMDPLGTAYKMEQYFGEFKSLFDGTWFSFISGIFPVLSSWSVGFSVIVIVFEIVLGLMLILGAFPKFTKWAFLILVLFFTFLTGFTYLTGYVPSGEYIYSMESADKSTARFSGAEVNTKLADGWVKKDSSSVNFFNFGHWVPFTKSNQKVTDCGCFGDFLKLEPYTSFLKDIFLLFPAFFFLFRDKDMHQLFSKKINSGIIGVSIVGLLLYCLSNFVWDLPGTDFRPFANGTNLKLKKQAEDMASGNVQVYAYKLTNKTSGIVREVSMKDYMREYKNYPKTEWDYTQLKSDPALTVSDFKDLESFGEDLSWIKAYEVKDAAAEGGIKYMVPFTKVSEFDVVSLDGNSMTDEILNDINYNFFIVSHKLPFTETNGQYKFKSAYQNTFINDLNPVLNAAMADGLKVNAVFGGVGEAALTAFQQAVGAKYSLLEADNILLKTIVRSNPGVVLMKNGKIIKKWHISKLPSYAEIKAEYMTK